MHVAWQSISCYSITWMCAGLWYLSMDWVVQEDQPLVGRWTLRKRQHQKQVWDIQTFHWLLWRVKFIWCIYEEVPAHKILPPNCHQLFSFTVILPQDEYDKLLCWPVSSFVNFFFFFNRKREIRFYRKFGMIVTMCMNGARMLCVRHIH